MGAIKDAYVMRGFSDRRKAAIDVHTWILVLYIYDELNLVSRIHVNSNLHFLQQYNRDNLLS